MFLLKNLICDEHIGVLNVNLINLRERIIKHRMELHKIPELGFMEHNTSKYILTELEKIGYITRKVARTGVIAYKKGISSESVAFRADIDGLNVTEDTNVSFSSQLEGCMHACGHDGHTAILLGFAEYVFKMNQLKKGILFIFQPAEESPGGADVIVKEGILNEYKVGAIFGLHLYPDLEQGKIGLREGAVTAQAGEFDIYIKGKSGHGAMPHKANDALIVSAQLINSYQSIISRNMNPLDSCVITIGTIKGGEVRNIIPESIKMEGTIRTFSKEIYIKIKEKMLKMNKGLMEMFDVEIEIIFRDMYPPVTNDKSLCELISSSPLIQKIVEIEPMMIAEDFSYYQQKVPGVFFMLGSKNAELGYIHPLHSSKFNFDNEVLMDGVHIYDEICKSLKIYS